MDIPHNEYYNLYFVISVLICCYTFKVFTIYFFVFLFKSISVK